jgi:two-component system C4-dicarboxylate transport sensor histidine kinase DctB
MTKHQIFIRKYYWFLVPAIITLIASILVLVGYVAERSALEATKARMENTLAFQTATLKASMDKYSILAALIARRPDITYALSTSNPLQELPEANKLTNVLAGLSGASDVWIVGADGEILVSNQFPNQSVNIYNENYFQSALQGSMGRASIISHTGQRLYIFAAPVINQNKVVGSIIVRVDLEYLERVWVLLEDPMLAMDETGRVLISSIRPWRFKYFYSENDKNNNDYASEIYLVEKFTSQSGDRLKLYNALEEGSGRDYLQVSQYVALLEWQVHALANYDLIIEQRNIAVFIALLIIALLIMALGMWMSRQRRLLEEKRSQQAFALRLERQVRDRTHELTSSNQQLEVEIEERKTAEKHLREAQEELVQAAKLAGIGQMSTALAHEYNQPLAAIRSYADNATTFLSQDNVEPASDNLQRIKMLVDKMAALTSTLRNFAHKTDSSFERISIETVMDELVILLSPQAKKRDVNLYLIPSSTPVYIMADKGRLSQVMTNLVMNAIDAVTNSDQRDVKISWRKQNDTAVISVKDSGPGIPEDVKDKMFNAFFTTKDPGNGLGLGLVIVEKIVNDLDGVLHVREENNYGAVFEIVFPLTDEDNTET